MKLLDAIFAVTVAALCLSRCFPLSLNITPTKVKVGDEVSLECSGAKNAHTSIAEVLWIRVVRLAGRKWSRLAEHRVKDSCVITYGEISADDVAVSSEVGGWKRTYMTIKWRAAKEQIYGTYRCDVIGVTENEDIVVHSTDPVRIFRDNVCSSGDVDDNTEVLRLVKSRSEELSLLIKLVQEKQLSLSAEVDMLHAKISPVKKSDTLQLVSTNVSAHDGNNETADVSRFNTSNSIPNFNDWPKGSYSLMASVDTNCPDNTSDFEWTRTVYGFELEMDNVTDVFSQSSPSFRSLYQVTGNMISFNLTLCQANKTHGPDWPVGTYCIGKFGVQCPDGFTSRSLRSTDVRLWHFCCRSDGVHSVPVHLPTLSPFYLLRHGGECQAAFGMTFEPESFIIDTKNDDNLNFYESYNQSNGQMNDAIVHACYYKRNTQ